MKPLYIALIAVAVILASVGLIYATKSSPTTPSSTSSTTPTANTSKGATVTPTESASPAITAAADIISAKKVILKTDKGDIAIDLFPAEADKTVKNFVTLGNRGYYNGVIFHRVIKDFMIQGGDPTGTGSGGQSIYGARFADEINSHKIVVGTVAMANAGPNTNGSQFFIVTESAQPRLDGGYTVFGQVSDDTSMAVVRSIAAVPTNAQDRPLQDVKMTGFQVVE